MIEQMKLKKRNAKESRHLSEKNEIRLRTIRKGRLRQAKGITLIALVITIIVLLILVGITISTITGEDGILKKATSAVEKTKKEAIKERVQMQVYGSYNNDGKLDMNLLLENIKKNMKDELTEEPEYHNKDDENEQLRGCLKCKINEYNVRIDSVGEVVIYKDGEKVELPAQPGEDPVIKPDLTEKDISFTYIPDKLWTKGPVTIKAICEKATNGYTMQYSLDSSEWLDYPETGVERDINGAVYFKLRDDTKLKGDIYATASIGNIDKSAPTVTITVSTEGDTATVTATAIDTEKTDTNAQSGINESTYYFSSDDGSTWTPYSSESYTFRGLETGTTYNFKAKVSDNAENEGKSIATNKYYCAGVTERIYKYCETCKEERNNCWHCNDHSSISISQNTTKPNCTQKITTQQNYCEQHDYWGDYCWHCSEHEEQYHGTKSTCSASIPCGKLKQAIPTNPLGDNSQTTCCNCNNTINFYQERWVSRPKCEDGHVGKFIPERTFCSVECSNEYWKASIGQPCTTSVGTCGKDMTNGVTMKDRLIDCPGLVTDLAAQKTEKIPCEHGDENQLSHWVD